MSNNKDIVITSTANVPVGGQLANKPAHLVTLVGEGKKQNRYFVSFDTPVSQEHFIKVKGFFSELKEDEIVSQYKLLISQVTNENVVELWLPWHSISSVRSLVFKAK
jgi:hypothetical protein